MDEQTSNTEEYRNDVLAYDNMEKNSRSIFDVAIIDVGRVANSLNADRSNTNLRTVVRTAHASIEAVFNGTIDGWHWPAQVVGYRPDDLLVLRRVRLQVDDAGRIKRNHTAIPIASLCRLIDRIHEDRTGQRVDFGVGGPGYKALLRTQELRNRLTHPKTADDLVLELKDAQSSVGAFFWVLAFCISLMENLNGMLRERAAPVVGARSDEE